MTNQANWNPGWGGDDRPGGSSGDAFTTEGVTDVRQYIFRTDAAGHVFVIASMKDKPLVLLDEHDSNIVLHRAWEDENGQQAIRDAGYQGEAEPTWTAGPAPARITEESTAAPATPEPAPAAPSASGEDVTIRAGLESAQVTVEQLQSLLPQARQIIAAENPAAAWVQFASSIPEGQEGMINMMAIAVYLAHDNGLRGDATRLDTATTTEMQTFFTSEAGVTIFGQQPDAAAPAPASGAGTPPSQAVIDETMTVAREGIVEFFRDNNKAHLAPAAEALSAVTGSPVTIDDLGTMLSLAKSAADMPAIAGLARDGILGQIRPRLFPDGNTSGMTEAQQNDFILSLGRSATYADAATFQGIVERLDPGLANLRRNLTSPAAPPPATAGGAQTPAPADPVAAMRERARVAAEAEERRRAAQPEGGERLDFFRMLWDEDYKTQNAPRLIQMYSNIESMAQRFSSSNNSMMQAIGGIMQQILGFVRPLMGDLLQAGPAASGAEDAPPAAPNANVDANEALAITRLQEIRSVLDNDATANADALAAIDDAVGKIQSGTLNLTTTFDIAAGELPTEGAPLSSFAQSIKTAFGGDRTATAEEVAAALTVQPPPRVGG